MSQVVFIAIPSAGTVLDGALTENFLSTLASLMQLHPEITFIAPMVQDYQLLKFFPLEATWENWGRHCRALIERSDEVWVMQFAGWRTSVGVQAEIAHALERELGLAYVDPVTLKITTAGESA